MGNVFIYLKLVLTALFWGGTFVAGRILSQHVGPFAAAFWRFVVATAFLFLFVYRLHSRLPPPGRRQLGLLALLGLTGVFSYNFFFFSGLKTVPAGRAALIVASNPVFIALFASFFFDERLRRLNIAGILLSVAGAVTVISRGHPLALLHGDLGVGELLILGCVASWVAYSLLGKVAVKQMPPLEAVAYGCACGTIFLLLPAWQENGLTEFFHYPLAVWASIVYLGFFGSALGFVWYYQGIRHIGPSRAGVFINLIPVSALIFGHLLLDEPIDASLLAGGALVVGGVWLTNKRRPMGVEEKLAPAVQIKPTN